MYVPYIHTYSFWQKLAVRKIDSRHFFFRHHLSIIFFSYCCQYACVIWMKIECIFVVACALFLHICYYILDMNWTGLSWRQNLTTGRRSSLERPWSSMLLNRLCKQKYFRIFFSLKILNWIHARWSGCQLFLGLKISKKIAMYMHWQIKYFKMITPL